MTRKTLLAATVLASCSGAGLALAQPVSGLYIGGEGGANFEQHETQEKSTVRSGLFPSFTNYNHGKSGHQDGVAAVGSIGYGLGNGLRLEAEGDYRYNRIGANRGANIISSGGREQKYGGMANVLFDMDIGSPYAFPYIGGGAGYMWEDRRRQTSYTSYNLNTPGGAFSFPNATQFSSGVDSGFAYQAIAGISFPIPPVVGLSLTAEYRYFAMAGDRNYGAHLVSNGNTVSTTRFRETDNYNHSLMLGLRYAFNVAPPPVAAPPAAPAPVATASRTYLVFFDWDRADLSDRARQIIAEAARATTQVQVTRVEVTGNTDTTGTASYNQGLSVRRADAVAAELVRLGVPRAAITTQGVGFSHLLVPTGPGVREPQNRRVEIVLR